MKDDTKREVRLNARFNFEDDQPERGYLNITGKVKGISQLEIKYYYVDPDKPVDHETPDGARYNESNKQTIRLF